MKEQLSKEGLYDAEAIVFILCIQNQELHPELLDYASNLPNAHLYGYKFTYIEDGQIRVKPDLIGNSGIKELTKLLHQRHVSLKGHINNPLKFSIKLGSAEAAYQWNLLQTTTKLDVEKFADLVANYYETTQYPKSLPRLLMEDGITLAYESTQGD
jgi:hypothetical protein